MARNIALKYVAGMVAYVTSGTSKDHPLTLNATAPGDYIARVNGLLAVRIMLKLASGGRKVWFHYGPPHKIPDSRPGAS